MKILLALSLMTMLVLCPGCGGDSHESLAAESLPIMREIVTTLEGVKDEATARAGKAKLESLMDKMDQISARQGKLAAPTEVEIKTVQSKYGQEMADLQSKMQGHLVRIMSDEKLQAQFVDLNKAAPPAK